MGKILSQLGQLFLESTPTIIFVFFLLVILDRLFFRRLGEVLKQREEATRGAVARAREETALAEARWREYEMAFQAARQEVYRLREAERREALQERENALHRAGEQTQAWLNESQAALTAQAQAARQELERTCRTLAGEITELIIGEGRPGGRELEVPR